MEQAGTSGWDKQGGMGGTRKLATVGQGRRVPTGDVVGSFMVLGSNLGKTHYFLDLVNIDLCQPFQQSLPISNLSNNDSLPRHVSKISGINQICRFELFCLIKKTIHFIQVASG